MRKTIFTILALAAVVACEKGVQQTDVVLGGESNEIVFTTKSETKAVGAVTMANLASFNVMAVTGTLGSSETKVSDNFVNAAFSRRIEDSYGGGKYWPLEDESWKFYASNVSMTFAETGPTINAPNNTTDVVCAVCATPSYKTTNALTFNHIFARLGTCKVKVEDGYKAQDITITMTPKTSGTYNLYSGNGKTDGTGWSSTSGSSAITLSKGSAATPTTAGNLLTDGESVTTPATDTYVVPGSYTVTATYTLIKGSNYSKTFTNKVSAAQPIVGGKINNLTVNLGGGDAVEVTFTVSVTPWTTNDVTYSFGE